MNGPFQVAQANVATQTSGKPPARIVKVTKPFGDQSVIVPLSYDGSVKADLSSIAGENITLVHIGEKLIILFDNKSTVTLEPFFDSNGQPLNGITVEVSPGRDLTGTEFAQLFPVTEDRSILPAAGDSNAPGATASGAYFTSVAVDPLAAPNPLDLLGQEDLPNFTINTLLRQNDFINGIPSAGLNGAVALDEDEIAGVLGNPGGPGDINAPSTFSGTLAHDFGLDGAGSIGFAAMNGVQQVINGITVTFSWNEATHTLIANDGSGDVFEVVVTNPATGAYTVTLLSPLHHHSDALADNTEASDSFNLTYTVTDSNGTTANGTLTLEINDDTPVAHDSAPTDTVVVIGEGEGQEGGQEVVTQYATIDDDGQANGNSGDNTNGDTPGDATSVSGKLDIAPGADGLKAVAFTGLDGQPHVTVTADDGSHPALQVIFVNQAGIGTPENVTLVWQADGNGGGTLIGISEHYTTENPAFTLTVDAQGNYTFDVHAPFAQPLTNDGSEGSTQIGWEDNIHVQFTYTATDGDGDKSSATLTFNIDDDTPSVVVTTHERGEGQEGQPLLVTLDESIGGDRGADGAPNGTNDDTGNTHPDPTGTNPIGQMATAIGEGEGPGGLQSLFNVFKSPGADGEKSTTYSYTFSLTGAGNGGEGEGQNTGVATTLKATGYENGTIYLFQEDATHIVGRVGGENGDIAIRITLNDANDLSGGQLVVQQYLAIDHGEDGNDFDTTKLLELVGEGASLGVTLTTTITDGDGDKATGSATYTLADGHSSTIGFQDDGPAPLAISAANGAANGLFFDGFTPNNDQWGTGSGVNTSGTAGAWHIAASSEQGASNVQLERVGDGYRGADSPTDSVMVDMEATPGNLKLTQDIANLNEGDIYHLTFEIGAASDAAAGSAKLAVFWNGVQVGEYTPHSGVMQTISIDVTAGNGNNQLTFEEIGTAGDNTGTFLANVKLADAIIIDETAGNDAGSNDTDSAAVVALFTSVTNVGTDPNMDHPQYAQGTHPVIVLGTPDYGTDGPAAKNPIQIGLTVSSAGVDSGLTTTAGQHIYLFVENGIIVGRFDADNDANHTPETAAFAMSIDQNGNLSIVQYVSLHQPDTGSHDEGVYLNSGTVLATVTLTDGDGDHTTSSADISSAVRFEDDGPSIDPAQNSSLRDWTLDEDVLPTGNDAYDNPADTNDYTVLSGKPLGVNWGADGAKALTIKATDAEHPTIVVTDKNGTPVAGDLSSGGVALTYEITTNPDGGQTLTAYKGGDHSKVIFTLTFDPDAGPSGTFSFELKGPLDHPTGDGQNTLNLSFGFTATDGDGDTTSSSVTIRVTDDVPVVASNGTNYITNGDFQAGNWTLPAWWGSTATNVPGWAISGDPSLPPQNGIQFERQSDGFLGLHSSTHQGMIDMGGSPGNYDLTQQIGANGAPHLVAGQQYVLELEVGAPFPSTAKMEVWWNGTLIGVIDTNVSSGQMEKFAFIVTGSGNPATDQLTFKEIGEGTAPINGTVNGEPLQGEGYHGTYIANVKMFTLNGVVDEDALNNSQAHGVGDSQPGDGPDGTVVNGNVVVSGALGVKWGSDDSDVADVNGIQDGANSTLTGRSLTFTNANVAVLGVNSLTSNGAVVSFALVDNNTKLVGFVDNDHNGTYSNGDRLVLDVTLSDDGTGSFKFTLHDNLDHAPGASENDIALQFNFTATDSDGDGANGTFAVGVDDDLPVLVNSGAVSLSVNENDIRTAWSVGSSPFDGHTELSTGAAKVTGTLAGTVNFGADGPSHGNGGFAFADKATVLAYMESLHLYSKQTATGDGPNGKELIYTLVGNVLTAYEPNPQGNPVFTLTLNPNGSFEFRLFDELVHVAGDGTNTDLRSGETGSISGINFGNIIVATDGDGDSVTLGNNFQIKIIDDVPHADIDLTGRSVTVDESGGNNADNTTANSVRSLFAALESATVNGQPIVGQDPDVSGDNNGNTPGRGAIAYAHSDGPVVVDDSRIGADAPAYQHQYALSITNGPSSGLFTTDGHAIVLSMNNGMIVGTVVGGQFDGKIAFAIAIGSDGEVSVAQYLSIRHDDRGDPNESNDNGSNNNDASPNDTPNPIQQSLDGKIAVTLTVTDSDGDQSTDTVNIGKQITFLDDGPTVRSNSTVVLEDDDLPGGNEGGPGDVNAPQNDHGTLSHEYGADGPGSTVLTGFNLPPGLGFTASVSQDGLSITIKQNGVDVLKIELTDSTHGEYKVTQLHAIDHPSLNGQNGDNTENNVQFTVSYRVTDGDGDSANGSLTINVNDDTPEPNFVLKSGTLVTIDETPGLQNDDTNNPFPVNVSNHGTPGVGSTFETTVAQSNGAIVAVTPHYGADGPGSTVFTIDVSSNGAFSGLTTTDGSHAIRLFEVSPNLIVGRYDTHDGNVTSSDPAAFAIYIDPTTGVMSVQQYVPIKHDDRGDFDESNDNGTNGNDASPNDNPNPVQQSIIDGAVKVTVTVTDHDGDSVDQTYNIGNKITFEDDGPSITITATSESSIQLITQDADTIGTASDVAVSTANFSGVFTTTTSYGADGAGSTNLSYTLAVTGTPGAGGRVDSGLDSHGATIYLYNVNGTIIGSTSLSANGINDGNKIFSLSVDNNGVVKLTQFAEIDHPIGSDPSPSGAPFGDDYATLGNNKISLTRSGSITDGDGDTATSSATIDLGGNIRFQDDGPSITAAADTISVDEANLPSDRNPTNVPGSIVGIAQSGFGSLHINWGADNSDAKHLAFAKDGNGKVIGPDLTSDGVKLLYEIHSASDSPGNEQIVAYKEGDPNHTPVFAITLYESGNGGYAYVQYQNIDQPGASTDTAQFSFNIIAYDADGDSVKQTLTIQVKDDAPTAGNTSIAVDEDNLSTGNADVQDGDDLANPSPTVINGHLSFTAGADGLKSLTFETMTGAVQTTGGAAVTMGHVALTYVWVGNTLWATTDAAHPSDANSAFKVTITDPSTGAYTFTLLHAVDHPLTDDSAAAPVKTSYEDNLDINLTFTVKDGDNDTKTGTLSINIDDDSPSILSPEGGATSEANIAGGTATAHGSLDIHFGADGPAATVPSSGGTPHTINFDDAHNGPLPGGNYTHDGFNFHTNQGIANVTDHAGQMYGTLITVWNTGNAPFTITQMDLGLYGTSSSTLADNVRLIGVDTHGNNIVVIFNVGATIGLGDAATTFHAAGTAFDGVQLVSLQIEPVLGWQGNDQFNGSVVVDNVVLNGGSAPLTHGAVSFTDLTTAINNITIVDSDNHVVAPAGLTSQGQAIHYTLLDSMTLVAYTGDTKPTAIDGANVVFSVVLSQDANHPNGNYDFTLHKPLDNLPAGSTSDLNLTFNFTAKDGDGDAVSSHFTVDVKDDVPVAHNDVDSTTAATQTLTFDDIALGDGAEQHMPTSYHGFNFIHTGVTNPLATGPYASLYATHSGDNLAFIGEKNGIELPDYTDGAAGAPLTIEHTDGSKFTALGAWFSAHDAGSLTITIKAYDANNVLIGTLVADIQGGNGPTWIDMSSLGSVHHITMDSPAGQYFGFDDFSYRDDAQVATGNVLNGSDGGLGSDANATDGVADTFGADGFQSITWNNASAPNSGVSTIVGLYGTLTVDANGNYSYKLNPDNAAVIHWTTGDADLIDTFTYTIKDGDGDTSTATLTIHGTGADDGVGLFNLTAAVDGGEATVYESGLPTGSAHDAALLTQTGTFNFTTPDGIKDLVIGTTKIVTDGAVTIPGSPISTQYGEITITGVNLTTGVVSYSYTLTHNTTDHGPLDNGSNNVFDDISVKVTDRDGDTASSTIDIKVVDDVPTATSEASQTLAEGTSVTGVLDFVKGADGATVTQINGVALHFDANDSGYSQSVDIGAGTIKVKADGSYVFTADAAVDNTNGAVPVHATFTVTDGDGDKSTANIDFAVTDANHPTGGEAFAAVDDDGLTGGNPLSTTGDLNANQGDASGDTSEATFTGTLPGATGADVPGTFDFASLNNSTGNVGQETVKYTWADNVLTATITNGARTGTVLFTVEVTDPATGAYHVTLEHNVLHAAGNNDENGDITVDLPYTVTDHDGSPATGTLHITFDDDAPTATADVNEAQSGQTVTGNVITDAAGHDAAGADGIASITWTNANNGTIIGQHGTLTIGADGSYSYQAFAHAASGSDVFEYTITDGDGDRSTTTLTIDVTSANTLPTAGTTTASVDDEGLAHGIAGNGQSTGDVTLPSPENVANGTLPHDYQADGKAASDPISFASMDGQHGTVGTESVTYHWDAASNTLVATSDVGRGDIFKVVVDGGVDNGDGNYQLTLLKPVMHASGNGENDATVDLTYQVKDSNSDITTGKLTVTFNDDTPVAQSSAVTVEAGKVATVDIQFIVDRSLSMFASAGGGVSGDVPGYSDDRMGLARYSMEQLLESNAQIEHVQIIRFGATADGTVWMTRAEALDYIQNNANWTSSTGTNYDLALQQAMNSYGNGPTNPADKSLVYFLSDGAPDGNGIANGADDNNHTNNSVTTGEWENFVNGHNIDDVYAIGIGSGVSTSNLEPVAYPNTDGPDAGNTEDNVILVGTNNLSGLLGTLQDMLGSAESVSGNVVTDHVNTGFGADGGHIQSITIGGITFTFTPGNTPGTGTIGESGMPPAGYVDHGTWAEITTAIGGKLTFYFEDTNGHNAGDYSYLAPTNTAGTESIHYVVVDGDGDTAGADLTINVTVPPPTYALTGAPEVTEGGDLVFHLDLSHANATDTVFTIGTQNGTATGGADFETSNFEYSTNGGQTWINAGGANHDQVTIAAGQTSVLIRVDTTDDNVDEANNESMNLVVTGVSGTVAASGNDGTEQGLIDDNDATPVVSISNGTTSAALAGVAAPTMQAVQEGESVYFQVKLSSASSGAVTVQLDITDNDSNSGPGGNAAGTNSNDYSSGFRYSTDGGATWLDATGTNHDLVTIPAGATSIIVRVDTVNDSTAEDLEAFRVSIDQVTSGTATIASTTNASDGGFGNTGEGDIAANDHAPTITSNASFNVAENTASVATMIASDPDLGGAVSWSIDQGNDATKFKIDATTGALSFVNPPNFEAANDVGGTDGDNVYVVTVRATDSDGLTATKQISVTVTDVNEQPSAGDDIVVTKAENTQSGTVLATVTGADPDVGGGNDSSNNYENLTYSIVSGNDAGLFTINSSGQISLASGKQLDYETQQQHVLTVRVSDGPGLFDEVQVTVKVTDVNEVPTTNDVTASANEGVSSVQVVLTGNDPEGALSSFKITGLPSGGTLYSDAGLTHAIGSGDLISATGGSATVYFKPSSADANGTSTFHYTSVDSSGLTDATPATATVTINSVNDAPSGADKTFTITEDGSKSSFTAADFGFSDTHDNPANSLASVIIKTLPGAGALLLNGVAVEAGDTIMASDLSKLTFTPYADENGTGYASFTFQVKDNGGTANGGVDTDPATHTITFDVTAVNDAPVVWAPSDLNFVPASGSTSDTTYLNMVKFADVDSTGNVTVKFTTDDNGARFFAANNGGVTVSGNNSTTLTLVGTIAAINTFIADNHISYDMNDTSTDHVTVSINDGSGGTDSATINVAPNSVSSSGEDLLNNDTFNVHQTTIDLDTGSDSIVTGWNHVGSAATTYLGGENNGTTDTIRVVFTGDQLNEILNNVTQRNDLHDFLSNPNSNDLDLSSSSWHAIAKEFEVAQLGLAAPRETSGQDNYLELDTWGSLPTAVAVGGGTDSANLIVGTAAGQTLEGLGGNDVLAAYHSGANTLNGGSGNDLLLGGDGNDILNGGQGNDILAGGKGADTFKIDAVGTAHQDTIADYDFTQGDKLDLSALLDNVFQAGDSINSFVKVTATNNDLLVQVDTTGHGTFGTAQNAFLLAGANTDGHDPVKIYFEGHDHVVTG